MTTQRSILKKYIPSDEDWYAMTSARKGLYKRYHKPTEEEQHNAFNELDKVTGGLHSRSTAMRESGLYLIRGESDPTQSTLLVNFKEFFGGLMSLGMDDTWCHYEEPSLFLIPCYVRSVLYRLMHRTFIENELVSMYTMSWWQSTMNYSGNTLVPECLDDMIEFFTPRQQGHLEPNAAVKVAGAFDSMCEGLYKLGEAKDWDYHEEYARLTSGIYCPGLHLVDCWLQALEVEGMVPDLERSDAIEFPWDLEQNPELVGRMIEISQELKSRALGR